MIQYSILPFIIWHGDDFDEMLDLVVRSADEGHVKLQMTAAFSPLRGEWATSVSFRDEG